MPQAGTIYIIYEVEVDPGGSIPGWIANMFVAKGPFETFGNLGKKLKNNSRESKIKRQKAKIKRPVIISYALIS
jgi:hypothetical protein